MRRVPTTAAVLGTAVAAALAVLAPVPAGAAPPPPSPAPAAAAGPAEEVTLLTGDRVLVRPGGRVEVRPGPGRQDMAFEHRKDRGHLIVLPADAAAAVRQGRADRRLFDVTTLLESGYGDARRDDLPLLLTGPAGAASARAAGATRVRPLAGGRVTAVTAARTGALWRSVTSARSAGTKVWLDGRVRATLDRSVPQIGAPAAWRAGHTGAGTTVAVLDTGVDTDHPDLAGAVVGSRDFTGNPAGVEDGHGHGTHVASIVTGSGAASDGRHAGAAPDTDLLVGKVLDDTGNGSESQVIAGMEWAAARGADVVNLSLGTSGPSDGSDPMSQAVDRLTRETDTLFVVAAGNDGPSDGTIGAPAAADAALTVGAVDATDTVAPFSGRGPRAGDGAVKPDLTAPGVDVVAARATGSTLGDPVGEAYQRLSGTSMAAPHVAGAAAILAGQHPTWTAAQLKAALVGAAAPTAGAGVLAQGSGRVDLARAVTQTAWATPVSVSGGLAEWPHGDDPPVVRPVTYTNAGSAPLVLDLAADLRGPDGSAAPAGLVDLSATTLTVPAGGTAGVTVTLRTTGDLPDGRYGGLLTATGRDGHTVLRTAVTVDREAESYDLTISVRDRAGALTPDYDLRLVDLDQDTIRRPYHASGTVVVRLPKGRYFLEARVLTGGRAFTAGYEPGVVMDRDSRLVLDAREGRVPVLRTQRPAAVGLAAITHELRTETGWESAWTSAPAFEDLSVLPSQTSGRPGEFRFGVEGVLARPDGTGGFRGTPYQYHLAWSAPDRVPADLTRSFRDRDLGAVRTAIAGTGSTAVKDRVAELALPAALTELYSPDHDWSADVLLYDGPAVTTRPTSSLSAAWPRRYRAGSRTAEQWGRAVVGPVLPPTQGDWVAVATRLGDTLRLEVPLHGDADGHPGRATSTGTSTLYRDGAVVASEPVPGGGWWDVPPDPATYRLETSSTGPGMAGLSTTVSGAWTFRSAATEEWAQTLPLLIVRFSPPVDARNSARAGLPFVVPVRVEPQAGAVTGRLLPPVVDVSYDEGRTWRRAPVVGGLVLLRHPAGATSVSLRATAGDTDGNKVEQTVLRAYALR